MHEADGFAVFEKNKSTKVGASTSPQGKLHDSSSTCITSNANGCNLYVHVHHVRVVWCA